MNGGHLLLGCLQFPRQGHCQAARKKRIEKGREREREAKKEEKRQGKEKEFITAKLSGAKK